VEPFPAVCPRFFHIRKSLGKIVILSALLFDWMMRLRNAKGDSDCDEKKRFQNSVRENRSMKSEGAEKEKVLELGRA